MKKVVPVQNRHQLHQAFEFGAEEVILSPSELSRFGSLSIDEGLGLIEEARGLGLSVFLECDRLVLENDFNGYIQKIKEYPLHKVSALRILDPGVLNFAFKNFSCGLHFIAETGNHNLLALKSWENHFSPKLKRIVLSTELSKDKIQKYAKGLELETELMVLGRILLLSTPRKILTDDQRAEVVEALAHSEESPHKNFPTLQNSTGTYYFHGKHLNLLNFKEELSDLSSVRFDLRFENSFDFLKPALLAFEESDLTSFNKLYPFKSLRGFFHLNKTDVLFSKLKNEHFKRLKVNNNDYAEVVDRKKDAYLALRVLRPFELKLADQIQFMTPEGKEKSMKVTHLSDLNRNDFTARRLRPGEYIMVNDCGGLWSKSILYFD